MNSVSLSSVTSTTNAAAYSLGQQLIVTAWNVVFAIVVVTWVFGWTGGKQLVGQSYTGAKEKAAEQSAAHKARKAEKKPPRRRAGKRQERPEQPRGGCAPYAPFGGVLRPGARGPCRRRPHAEEIER